MIWTVIGWSAASFLFGVTIGGWATVRLLIAIDRLEKKRRQDRQ